MNPLFIPNENHTIGYGGNKIFKPIRTIKKENALKSVYNRINDINKSEMWQHITRINHTINMAANQYFDNEGCLFAPLPLTTRMISSPGALYGKESIDYTADTIPVKLNWFDYGDVFLSESSQIYLELYLTIRKTRSVYAIYNSFRKEPSDATHLAEFHHIEYEGKVSQKINQKIAIGLLSYIIRNLLKENHEDLSYFLYNEDMDYLKDFAKNKKIVEMTFSDALDLLYKTTKEKKYQKFTSKHFGSWEEVKVSTEVGNILLIKEFPLYEIAFYHAPLQKDGREVGENADII